MFWRDWLNLIRNLDEGAMEAAYLGIRQPTIVHFTIPLYVLATAVVFWICLEVLGTRRPRWFRFPVTIFALLSPFVLFTFGHCFYNEISHPDDPPPIKASGSLLQRTVVLVFDELDEGVFFEETHEGFSLPHFQELRGESFVATRAYSAHGCTLLSIPAMLTGQKVSDARALSDESLEIDTPAGSRPFEAADNLFAEANAAGARTALIGYFHPYCRLFGKWVDRCRSISALEFEYSARPVPLTFAPPWLDRETIAHERGYKAALKETLDVVADTAYDLIFVHVPVPRLPGIGTKSGYSREAYLANGVMADEFLNEVRKKLGRTGLWGKTNLLLTSDHGYRDAANATELEKGGPRYRHVPLIFKFPDRRATAYLAAVSTVGFKSWVLGMLEGKIPNSVVLEKWLKASPYDPKSLDRPANEYCKLPAATGRVQ